MCVLCAVLFRLFYFLLMCFNSWQFSNLVFGIEFAEFLNEKNRRRNRRPKIAHLKFEYSNLEIVDTSRAFHSIRLGERVYANLYTHLFCLDSYMSLACITHHTYTKQLNSIDFQLTDRFVDIKSRFVDV